MIVSINYYTATKVVKNRFSTKVKIFTMFFHSLIIEGICIKNSNYSNIFVKNNMEDIIYTLPINWFEKKVQEIAIKLGFQNQSFFG